MLLRKITVITQTCYIIILNLASTRQPKETIETFLPQSFSEKLKPAKSG